MLPSYGLPYGAPYVKMLRMLALESHCSWGVPKELAEGGTLLMTALDTYLLMPPISTFLATTHELFLCFFPLATKMFQFTSFL